MAILASLAVVIGAYAILSDPAALEIALTLFGRRS
jgi:hypothetical protein